MTAGQVKSGVKLSRAFIDNELNARLPFEIYDADLTLPVLGDLDTEVRLIQVDQWTAELSEMRMRLKLAIVADKSGLLYATADLLIYVYVKLIPNYPIENGSPLTIDWYKTEIDESSKTKLGFVSVSDETVLKAIEGQREKIETKIQVLVDQQWAELDLGRYLVNRAIAQTGLLVHAAIESLLVDSLKLSEQNLSADFRVVGSAYLNNEPIDVKLPRPSILLGKEVNKISPFPFKLTYQLDLLGKKKTII